MTVKGSFDINVTLIGLIEKHCYRINDLKGFYFLSQDVANGLQNLLDYDGDVEDDFGLSFQVSVRMLQEMIQIMLQAVLFWHILSGRHKIIENH